MTPTPDHHLHIGAIIFPQGDQLDFTGPFEILSSLPNSTFHILWKHTAPDTSFAEAFARQVTDARLVTARLGISQPKP